MERLLGEGMVLVHLDARLPGVKVPVKLANDPRLRLNLSYRFSSRDLVVGDDQLSCTLSFSGMPFRCVLPLRAIYAATSHVTGESVVWTDDVPDDVTEEAPPPVASEPSQTEPAEAAPEAKAPARQRSHLRLVK
ncbi:MAG: ClpXP protease specificity-enhancing factor SspB [Deltaproteobacteria bacterium]